VRDDCSPIYSQVTPQNRVGSNSAAETESAGYQVAEIVCERWRQRLRCPKELIMPDFSVPGGYRSSTGKKACNFVFRSRG
jgi:hypothetical protein